MESSLVRKSKMDIDIGLSEESLDGVIQILNNVLCDEYVLYTKTRNYHWNVVGPHFNDRHEFFQEEEYRNNNREEIKLPYTKEDLFSLHQISFAIEQAITTFFEITKDNEIIYEIDFENDRVQWIHTKYNGEPESWGWQKNVKEQLSKIKPISNIVIRDEQDIYDIVTNREKLEDLFQEYEKQLDKEEQSKGLEEKEINNEHLKSDLKLKIKEELEKSHREQQKLLKENKQNIIDFIIDNKDSIKVDDLRIYEPVYKSFREKGSCIICNNLSNIICTNCNHKEIWLCTKDWQKHKIEKHE